MSDWARVFKSKLTLLGLCIECVCCYQRKLYAEILCIVWVRCLCSDGLVVMTFIYVCRIIKVNGQEWQLKDELGVEWTVKFRYQ